MSEIVQNNQAVSDAATALWFVIVFGKLQTGAVLFMEKIIYNQQ